MNLLTIDETTCTKCGRCAEVCPAQVIYFKKEKSPRLVPGGDLGCILCGHCVACCPTGSLDHADVPLVQAIEKDARLVLSFEQGVQFIQGRRSVRTYRYKPVPDELLTKAIDAARFAPTGHNAQEVRWLIINGQEKIKHLAEIGTEWMRFVVANVPAMKEMVEPVLKRQESGTDGFLRGAPAVVVAYAAKDNPIARTDCALALGYFDLAANAAGLGCCWAGFFYMSAGSFSPMVEAVGLPEGCAPYGALMVGYPKYDYPRIPARKPVDITRR